MILTKVNGVHIRITVLSVGSDVNVICTGDLFSYCLVITEKNKNVSFQIFERQRNGDLEGQYLLTIYKKLSLKDQEIIDKLIKLI